MRGGGLEQSIFPMHTLITGQVRMQINQARQQRDVAEVDELGSGRHRQRRSNGSNPLALNTHHGWRQHGPAGAINETSRP
jgi:hypothetical protein